MKKKLAFTLILVLLVAALAACDGAVPTNQNPSTSAPTTTQQSTDTDNELYYSDGLDNDGHFIGVRALDYVSLFDYETLSIPQEECQVTDDMIQSEIDGILETFSSGEPVYDRAVQDGDQVNIDYVGKVDGIPFSGGSTEGAGTDVTAGSTDYIDDFLTQIIGHMPGETIEVLVTFPNPYTQNTDLSGKDAVFETTINYVYGDSIAPELTDEFVSSNFSSYFSWNTVQELKDGIREHLLDSLIQDYLRANVVAMSDISALPESMIQYYDNTMLNFYRHQANESNVSIEEVLMDSEGISTEAELLDLYRDMNAESTAFALVVQAIAEKESLAVDEDYMSYYFSEFMGYDYSDIAVYYGVPSAKQIALTQMVIEFLADKAVLE